MPTAPCFSQYDSECQALDYFSQEAMDSPEFRDKLVKLRFTLPTQSGGSQRVTECYDIDSLFHYVYQQIFENAPEIVTPTKKSLSQSQIDRIQRCYFKQDASVREWDTLHAFNTEMARRAQERELEERSALISMYQNESSEDILGDMLQQVGNDVDQRITVNRWLHDMFPDTLFDRALQSVIYDDIMSWLDKEGLLRFDRYTLDEILEDPFTEPELVAYLESEYPDLEPVYD